MAKQKLDPIIECYLAQIKLYEKKVKILETQKPFWFQKKRLIKYNDNMKQLEKKIFNLYQKIEKEIDFNLKLLEDTKKNDRT